MGAKHAVPGRIGLLLILVVLAWLVPASAEAAFPGTNGRIAFSSNRDGNFEIYTMNSDGTGVWRLTNDSRADRCPHWSADGRMIVWERDFTIWLMNADGTDQHAIPATAAVAGASCPSWSADGTQIVFSGRGASGADGINVVNTDGTGLHELSTQSGAHGPSWSPNGQKIAFARYDPVAFGYHRIYVINPDGTGPTQLTFNTGPHLSPPDCCPDWSPDSSKLLFWGADGLETINPDGTGRTLLTDQVLGPPAWSPDGTKLVVNGSDGSDQEIYTFNSDGTGQVQITSNSYSDATPDWQAVTGPPPPGYARPKAATPTTVRLVLAQAACGSANAAHGTPLAQPSCSPPQQASLYLTVGTPDANGLPANSIGVLTMKALGETPTDPTNGDQSDVAFNVSITDVHWRDQAGGPETAGEYTGQLLASFALRLTDRFSGSGGVHPATSVDTSFSFTFQCSPTDDPTLGGTCSAATTADAIMPGVTPERKRAIWQIGQVQIFDGGADGEPCPTCSTLFMTQGLFTP